MLAFGLAGHALLSRAVKAVLWSWSPLATGEPEAACYERRVYHSADAAMMQIVAAAALSGLPWWVALATGRWAWGWLGVLAMAGVVVWDVLRWERVASSASNLWFQRGFRGRVHQVALDNIRDVSVEELDARGFTLRHGVRNRLARLNVRMNDRRVVALPKTDAYGGLDDVEAVANHLRQRMDQLRHQESLRQAGAAPDTGPPGGADEDLRRALRRLRQGAALKRSAH